MPKHIVKFLAGVFTSTLACLALTSHAQAYPQFAQQGYEEPREPTGRIVCANCHLAEKPVDIELPQAVFPDSVFVKFVGCITHTISFTGCVKFSFILELLVVKVSFPLNCI